MFSNLSHLFKLFVIVLYGGIHAQNSLVSIDLKVEEVESDSLSFVCVIENQEKDTIMVLSQPFLIEGESSRSHQLHPWPGSKFTANVLYYEQSDHLFSFSGDADIRQIFDQFPKLIVIPPQKKIVMKLLVPSKYLNDFKNDDYNFWLTLTYGLKSKLNDLTKTSPELRQQYQNALVEKDSIFVSLTDSLSMIEEDENNLKISTTLWNGMNYKAHSSKVVLSHND